MRWLVLLVLVCGAAWWWYGEPDYGGFGSLSPHRHAPDPPVQEALETPRVVRKGDYTIHLTHRFALRALVLSAKTYSLDRESALAPVDLALGWGKMSNPAPLRMLEISQRGRFYRWRYENRPPMPEHEITASSANMHMIPADREVERALRQLRRGDVIELAGYLVRVRASDGWSWQSSLTRHDAGHGACEVVYVISVQPVNSVPSR
jgi:hypothetical protein